MCADDEDIAMETLPSYQDYIISFKLSEKEFEGVTETQRRLSYMALLSVYPGNEELSAVEQRMIIGAELLPLNLWQELFPDKTAEEYTEYKNSPETEYLVWRNSFEKLEI